MKSANRERIALKRPPAESRRPEQGPSSSIFSHSRRTCDRPDRAELELLAQAAEYGLAVVAGAQDTRQMIRPLALALIVDQRVGRVAPLKLAQSLGINPGPEEREIADMAVAFSPARGVTGCLGFGDHRRNLKQPFALGITKLPDPLAGHEARQELGDVSDERWVADAQLVHERVFGQASEEPVKRMRFGNRRRIIHARALLPHGS